MEKEQRDEYLVPSVNNIIYRIENKTKQNKIKTKTKHPTSTCMYKMNFRFDLIWIKSERQTMITDSHPDPTN